MNQAPEYFSPAPNSDPLSKHHIPTGFSDRV
ncbi:MAG: hypothetical protein ACI8VY_001505, partial [Cellvibrionaceae bacterium]